MPNPSDPQAFNRYTYAYNNPLRYIDPSGHASVCGFSYSDPECPDSQAPTAPIQNPPSGGSIGGSSTKNKPRPPSPDESEPVFDLPDGPIINPPVDPPANNGPILEPPVNTGIGLGIPVLVPIDYGALPDFGIYPTLWKPKQRGDDATWNALARRLRIDVRVLRRTVEQCKQSAGLTGGESVVIDDKTGNIIYDGEVIGNVYTGC